MDLSYIFGMAVVTFFQVIGFPLIFVLTALYYKRRYLDRVKEKKLSSSKTISFWVFLNGVLYGGIFYFILIFLGALIETCLPFLNVNYIAPLSSLTSLVQWLLMICIGIVALYLMDGFSFETIKYLYCLFKKEVDEVPLI